MNLNISKILTISAIALSVAACSDDLDKNDYNRVPSGENLATATTGGVVECYGKAAVVNISTQAIESNPVNTCGVVFSSTDSLEANLTVSADGASFVKADANQGSANVTLNDLEVDSTYYYRAFAYTANGLSYGEIKKFKAAADGWNVEPDITFNLNDATLDENDGVFSTFQISGDEGSSSWSVVPLGMLGMNANGLVSTCFDPDALFNSSSGQDMGTVDNVLCMKLDLTGLRLPQLQFDMFNVAAFFGENGYPASFTVYVSDQPITDEASLESAKVLGTASFKKFEDLDDANKGLYQEDIFTFDLPAKYNKVAYVALRNNSNTEKDYGVLMLGCALQSFHKIAE